MALEKLQSTDPSITTRDLQNHRIQELSNTPNADGMSATDLKKRFDAAPDVIANTFNKLIDALQSQLEDDSGADCINVSNISGIIGTTVQTVLEALASQISQHTTDISPLIKSVTFDSNTGRFTFTRFSGQNPIEIDTALEKVVVNFTYDRPNRRLVLDHGSGVSPRYEYVDLSDLVTEYDFQNSSSITFSVSGHSVTATLDSSFYDALMQAKGAAETAAQNAGAAATTASAKATEASGSAGAAAASESAAQGSATTASNKASESGNKALVSEGYALGTQNGVPVGPTSPYYQNNSKYYKEQAEHAVTGDMTKSVYDTHNKQTDIFDYADKVAENENFFDTSSLAKTTNFVDATHINEVGTGWHKETVFVSETVITETMTRGSVTKRKTTTFVSENQITEIIEVI